MGIEFLLIILLSINMFLYVGLILLFKFNFKSAIRNTEFYPNVSILVSCRNEAENISALMDSLESLDYPNDKLEILVANDGSEDNTLELLQTYESSNIQIHDITGSVNNLKGKMNALAQLFDKSTGDFIFITDADSTVHPGWIKSLLSHSDEKTGIVAGLIDVKSFSFFSGLQSIDYMQGQGIMKVASDLDLPLFASGNNMMVTRKAYEETGGYKNMNFHVTEDVLLLKRIIESGYKFRVVFNPESMVTTNSFENILPLLIQRKRWMAGFGLMSFGIKLSALLRLSVTPLLLSLIIITPVVGFGFFLLRIVFSSVFLIFIGRKINKPLNLLLSPLYDFYELVIYLSALVLHLFNRNIIWKGRKLPTRN